MFRTNNLAPGVSCVKASSSIVIDMRMYRMSGIGRYLQCLLPSLIPLIDARKIIILGCVEDLKSEPWTQDGRVILREFRCPIFSVAEQLAVLSGAYREADLLWVPQFNIPLFYRGRLVVTIHDVCQLAHPEVMGSGLQRWYARRLLSAVASRAEAILCVSEFTATEVQRYLDVDRSRLVVTYPNFSDSQCDSGFQRPGSDGSPYLLAVGNIKKHKNLKLLIAAFESVCNQIPHRLVVVGKQNGFLNSETELSGASTLLDGRVRFTGHISEQELGRYYRHADALIFPSIYEGFGYPLVEAMAHGCPVACSNVSSLPEVAGDAALLFNPFRAEDIAVAIMMLATDEGLRTMLKERGLKRAEAFRGRDRVEKTAAVINRILTKHPIGT
jgi:glycosyltransferase involved in cell wall biosynthesis